MSGRFLRPVVVLKLLPRSESSLVFAKFLDMPAARLLKSVPQIFTVCLIRQNGVRREYFKA